MRLVQFTYKNMMRRPTRSGLTIAGIAIAVAAVVGLIGSADSLQRAMLSIFQGRGVDLIIAQAGTVQRMQSNLDERVVDRIAALPGVKRVAAGLADNFSYEELDGFGVVARGLDPKSFLIEDLTITEGRGLRPGDDRAVVLGTRVAASLKKHTGDTFAVVPGENFEVVGVYQSFNELENNSMIMPLHALQKLMDRQGKVSVIMVIAERSDRDTLDKLTAAIKGLGTNLDVLPARQYVDSMIEMRLLRQGALLTSLLALILGTIGMINTMLTAVFERTREIAVLRAVGWRKASVVRMVLFESLLMCVVGAVLGTLFAIGLTKVISRLMPGPLLSGNIGVWVIAQGFAVALVVGVLGGLFPAIRAARMLPTEGLRHE